MPWARMHVLKVANAARRRACAAGGTASAGFAGVWGLAAAALLLGVAGVELPLAGVTLVVDGAAVDVLTGGICAVAVCVAV